MTTPIYPLSVRGLTWPIMKTMESATTVTAAANFYENRVINSQNPRWHFTLIYEYLKDDLTDIVTALSPYTDYRTLQGFLLALQGKYSDLLFDDIADDAIGVNSLPGGGATNPSMFKPNLYSQEQLFYPIGSYIVDTGTTPHLQQVIQAGVPGTTVPSWNHAGGTTTSGGVIFQDIGVFNGANAQVIPVVTDSTDPVSAAVVNAGGSGFVVGDQLGVTGGGGTGAVLQVASQTGGAIVTFSIISGGSGYTTTTGAALVVLTGAGTGSPTADITATTLYYSPIQRNFGGQFLEDVTDLNTTNYALKIWDSGTLKTSGSDYTLLGPGLSVPGASYQGLYIKWAAAPTGPVTALAQFYYRLHLESDEQDVEEFMHQFWTIGGESGKNGSGMLKLESSRIARV